ncbi:MAG: IS66 family insertion sequence element accessory protein TnpA [Anaerostipes sp.]|jgi:transposase-like protein|nr:transposase [uncultured Anaerostipes sp.]
MRAKRRTEQEQYDMIMECRQSGLSDHQWCLEHDINPGTFYNWVRRFRKQACEFPAPAGKDRFQAVHQEVVKMEIIPDHPSDFFEQPSMEDSVEITKPVAAMELQIGKAVLRISNQTDPRLLEQTLKLLGAFSC